MTNNCDDDVTMRVTGSASAGLLAATATAPIQHIQPAVIGSRTSHFMEEGAAAAEALLHGLAEDPLGVALATGEPVAENAQVERESPGLTLMEQALTWPVSGPLALPTGNAEPSRDPLGLGRDPLGLGRALRSGIESSVPTAPAQCSLGRNSAEAATDNLTSVVTYEQLPSYTRAPRCRIRGESS